MSYLGLCCTGCCCAEMNFNVLHNLESDAAFLRGVTEESEVLRIVFLLPWARFSETGNSRSIVVRCLMKRLLPRSEGGHSIEKAVVMKTGEVEPAAYRGRICTLVVLILIWMR